MFSTDVMEDAGDGPPDPVVEAFGGVGVDIAAGVFGPTTRIVNSTLRIPRMRRLPQRPVSVCALPGLETVGAISSSAQAGVLVTGGRSKWPLEAGVLATPSVGCPEAGRSVPRLQDES